MKKIICFLLVIFLIGCSNKKEQSNSINANNNDSSKNKPAIIQNIELENTVNIIAQETNSKPGHTGEITSLVFSSDGKQIISCSYDDKYIRIWDVTTGQEIKTLLHDHFDNKYISFIRLSPDEKYIVSSSYSGINIWDRNTYKELISIYGFFSENESIMSIDITPDGKQIVAVCRNTTSPGREDITKIKLYDITTGKKIQTFLEYIKKVTSFAFSPDGNRVITSSFDDGEIKIWDVATEQELRTISEDLYQVNFISFSPNGKYFISRSESRINFSRYITIWDANSYIKIRDISISENFVPIVFNQNGSIIATIPYDGRNIQLIDIVTGKEIKTISVISGNRGEVTCLAFSPDGKMIVSGSDDKSIKLWDVATGKEIRTMGE